MGSETPNWSTRLRRISSDRFDQAFLYWNYVEKLCARYSELNLPIVRESFGPLTATLVPPCITITVELLEMLLSALEGNTFFSVSFSQSGSIEQDLAIAKVIRTLSIKYLKSFNLKNVELRLVYHHWMGAFPKDKFLSDSLINLGNIISIMINADKVIIKTRDEAFGIPEASSNAMSIRQTRYIQDLLNLNPVHNEIIEQEMDLLQAEVIAIMDNILNFPGDTLWRKTYNAIKAGILDIPFSPHQVNRGELISTRDDLGMIRIYDPGKVPLPEKLLQKEKEKIRGVLKDTKLIASIIKGINFMSQYQLMTRE